MRKIIGCMTGTSIDGIDLALLAVEGHGLDIQVTVEACHSMSLGELAPRLRAVADQCPHSAADLSHLMADFAALHNAAITACREKGKNTDTNTNSVLDLISVHGQTVFHQAPVSWQLLQPAPIAYTQQAPLVFDMRAADLAAGGQGAPMTPIADWVLFRHHSKTRAIINCGGFCNATFINATSINANFIKANSIKATAATDATHTAIENLRGADICACNHILDTIARRYLDCAYDDGGAIAAAAQLDHQAADALWRLLKKQQHSQRSLGSGDEVLSWIDDWNGKLSAPDLAASACDGLGHAIATCACEMTPPMEVDEIICAGGGIKNKTLMSAIEKYSEATVCSSAEYGIDPLYREAIAMAILGCLCQDRVAITIPAITGVAAAPIAGHWVLP